MQLPFLACGARPDLGQSLAASDDDILSDPEQSMCCAADRLCSWASSGRSSVPSLMLGSVCVCVWPNLPLSTMNRPP